MKWSWLALICVALLLSACGSNTTAASATPEPLQSCSAAQGDAARGEALFAQDVLTYYAGCSTCHMVDNDIMLQGPSLQGVGSVAAGRVAGQDAEQYLCQSILNPNGYLVEGFSASLMPPYYANWLTQQELDDLIAYLVTLE